MFFKYKCILIVFTIYISYCTPYSQLTIDKTPVDPDDIYCLQKRFDCPGYDNFCRDIQCEPILDCEESNKKSIVENITGHGCCPACVEFLDEDDNCEVVSLLKQCRNGLFCDPSTKQCNLPPVQNKCLMSYHNRRLVTQKKMLFYLEGVQGKKTVYFQIKYQMADLETPVCNPKSGEYQLSQTRGSKTFCVNPKDGKFTFGLTEKFMNENVTCKCSNYLNTKLFGDGNSDSDELDAENTKHYSEIHQKCDESGNFEDLQCINSTCFCVDPKNGKPVPGKVSIFGALSTLPCFDEEKSKLLETKLAVPNYEETCEKQLLKSRSMTLHFSKKGTNLRGLDSVICQLDGKFGGKQCKPGVCNCVNPKTGSQLGAYATDRSGGKDAEMECKCAREEYYANVELKNFDQLQCDQMGNYIAWQCFDNNRQCFCVDEDGARISSVEKSTCLDQFIKDVPGSGLLKEEICKGMRRSLTEITMNPDKFYKFVKDTSSYEEFPKPRQDELWCDGSGACPCAYADEQPVE